MENIPLESGDPTAIGRLVMAGRKAMTLEENGKPVSIVLPISSRKRSKEDIEAFLQFCDQSAEEAKQNGMTEETLNAILSER